MMLATTGLHEERPVQAIDAAELARIQRLVRRIPVGERVVEAILSTVRAARPEESGIDAVRRHVAWGPGPRASQAFMLAIRAKALVEGRLAPTIEDVVALAPPILRHRMALNFSARAEGVTIKTVVDKLTEPLA